MKTEVQHNQEIGELQIQGRNLSSLIEDFQVASTSLEETNYPPGLMSRKRRIAKDKSRRKKKGKENILNNIFDGISDSLYQSVNTFQLCVAQDWWQSPSSSAGAPNPANSSAWLQSST